MTGRKTDEEINMQLGREAGEEAVRINRKASETDLKIEVISSDIKRIEGKLDKILYFLNFDQDAQSTKNRKEKNVAEINNRHIIIALIRGFKLTVALLQKILKGEAI